MSVNTFLIDTLVDTLIDMGMLNQQVFSYQSASAAFWVFGTCHVCGTKLKGTLPISLSFKELWYFGYLSLLAIIVNCPVVSRDSRY